MSVKVKCPLKFKVVCFNFNSIYLLHINTLEYSSIKMRNGAPHRLYVREWGGVKSLHYTVLNSRN